MKRHLSVLVAVGLALAFPTMLALVSLGGCVQAGAPWPRPIQPDTYSGITNAVTTAAHTVAAVAPAPIATAAELVAAAVVAALAGWQAITHRRVRILINGNNETKDPKTK